MAQSVRRRSARRFPHRWWLNFKLWLILIAFLLLSGCVRYDVGVNFVDANHGTITQHVRLDDQITGVSRATAALWLDQLAEQTQQLGGQVNYPSAQELVMTIPFYNVKDLNRKFDQFFQAITDQRLADQPSAQPLSRFQIQTRNFILWQRHQLTYDLDLSALSIIPTITPTKAFVIDPQALLNLELTLNTPWGAEPTLREDALPATIRRQGQLVWLLKPGKINHLEASFSLPSPLGIGAAVIAIFVIAGMFLRAWKYPSSLIASMTDYPQ